MAGNNELQETAFDPILGKSDEYPAYFAAEADLNALRELYPEVMDFTDKQVKDGAADSFLKAAGVVIVRPTNT